MTPAISILKKRRKKKLFFQICHYGMKIKELIKNIKKKKKISKVVTFTVYQESQKCFKLNVLRCNYTGGGDI